MILTLAVLRHHADIVLVIAVESDRCMLGNVDGLFEKDHANGEDSDSAKRSVRQQESLLEYASSDVVQLLF